jgi:hypothetical protein
MASFDITSEIDMQEVRNAVDQTAREIGTRFDFKDTGATIELSGNDTIELNAPTDDRLRALRQVMEEKLIKRSISLKSIAYDNPEEASKGALRQKIKLISGIDGDKGKTLNKMIKDMGVKDVSSSIHGSCVRVTSKKRDNLQQVITNLKSSEFELPLQFGNFRE